MAGTKRGETEVNFKLHLPIDKRPIQLTPEQIKSQINWTAVLIKDLDKIIDKLENTINSFYIACFAMTAIVIVSQFFKGVGERRREAAEKAAEEKKLEGIKEEVGDGFKEAQKNIDRYKELEEKIKVKGGLNKLSTDEIVEYYDLVKDDPGYSTQKRNYEKSELKLNTLIMERFPELEAEGLEAKKAELFPELYTQKEVPAKFRDAGALHVLNDKDGKKIGSLVIKNGQIFKKGEPTIPLDNTILYDKDKQAYRINQETKQIEPYSSPYKNEKSKSGKTIYKDKVEGKNVYIVPASVGTNLPGQLGKDVTKYRRVHGDIYFVYYPGKRVVPHVVTGKEPNPQVDGSLPSYEKGTPQYIAFERGMGNVHYAQKSGIKSAQVFGKPFTISDAKSFFVSEAIQCDEVMSPTQCKMLFNACDPVVCPPSRCNLGGKLKGKVTSVQQSGLIGSVALCFPNIKEGIIVPFCLTGIRNSLKTIRGNLELYQRCLEKLLEGESVGICDQLRSVFICDIIWREFIGPIFDMAANSLLDKVRPGRGGGEYISGVKGPMERAKGVSSYFVQSYAQEMFAAYKGRVSAEIGTELCKVGIYGKVPAFGDIFADIVAGGDPVQYSAKFSEHVHSKVVGNSEYNVYYQIRAGSSKEPVNYVVTLQKCGPTQIHKFLVGRGVVKTNDIIDESVNMIGPSGCKEICMSVNADKRCVFGKVISTSWMLQEGADAINEKMLGREITEASACIPNYDAVLTAAVNRQCSIVSPGKNWERVGVCGIGEGRNKGDCWMEIDTADKEFKRSIEKRICRGVICTKNKFCVGEPVNVLEGGDVCCESVGDIVGDCKSKPFVKEIESELKKVKNEIGDGVVLLDKWFNGGLKESGEFGNRRMLSDDEAVQLRDLLDEKPFESYLYLSMTFLYNEDYENAEKAINMIELKGYEDELNKRLEHYNLGMGLIIDAKISLGDEKAKEFCSIYIKDMESKLESLGEEDKEKVTVVNKCEKFKEEKPEEAESAVVGLITGDSPIRKLESEDKLTIDGKVKIIDTVVRDFVNEKTIIIKYVGSDSTDTYSIDITIKQIPGFQKVERP